MERLTYMDGGKWRIRIGDTEYSGKEIDRFASYEDTGLEPETISKIRDIVLDISGDLDRLRDLVQADRDGRCVVLPCKVGERLWCINSYGEVEETVAVCFLIENKSVRICYREKMFLEYYNAPIGKVLFLNREAAEEALKGECKYEEVYSRNS